MNTVLDSDQTSETVVHVPMNRAVLVVDMLHEFVEGRLGSEKSRNIIPGVNRVIEHARREGWPVAYLCDDHNPDDPEIAVWGEHAMHTSYGSRLAADVLHPDYHRNLDLHDLAAEDIFSKQTYSGFTNSRLEPWLRQRFARLQPAELVLVGTATHICVAQTAIDAFQRGFKIGVVSDATCGFMDTDDSAWLSHIAQLTGAWLPDSDALVRVTAEAKSPHHE